MGKSADWKNLNGLSEDDKTCAITDMNCLGEEDDSTCAITDMNCVDGQDMNCAIVNMNCEPKEEEKK